ncbi:class I SAM-dependent methyltransferase [Haloglomus litoreum]|uniref:class I SAM-dependent methyltransferase n=1 Tax=Haloglomus litoreum TaxID=3034026 RepID=UPI0023E783E7|nr:class I SAM-dependent methyltransferase [Haloglomus sp. DT116]
MGTTTAEEDEHVESGVVGEGTSHDHGDASEEDGPAHPWFARLYDPVMRASEAKLFPPHREYLARDLAGDVLDLGAGTGAMLPYYEEAIRSGAAEVTMLEPDPHMREQAVAAAREDGIEVTVSDARAESLPFPDDSFDVVVASMVFCTIPDPEAALDEVARVLRPGGEFRFLEHVTEEGWRRLAQRALGPLWSRVAGGCRLTRRTGELFDDHEAFVLAEMERLHLGVFPVRPFVRGTLERRDSIAEMGADPSVRERVREAVDAARDRLARR